MIIKSSHIKISEFTSIREGESKLGEVIVYQKSDITDSMQLSDVLASISSRYVLVGISEDIGVRANYGKGGAEKAYDTFLRYFLNVQSTQFIDEHKLFILGEVFVKDLLELSMLNNEIEYLRELCADVDNRVYPIIQEIILADKVPVIIGGGHNNAYGNIKGTSLALNHPIEVLNIDPHADFRVEEGRHSGNGFRYAYNQNFLAKYAIWGLHESYNNQAILDALNDNLIFKLQRFDSILRNDEVALEDFLSFFGDSIGLELDLDSIKDMPSSAMTPVGFSEEEILKLIYEISLQKKILYYHFCEGLPSEYNQYKVGKFLSYLVVSILKLKMNDEL